MMELIYWKNWGYKMEMLKQISEQFDRIREARGEMQGRIKLLQEQEENLNKSLDKFTDDYKNLEETLDVLREFAVIKEQVLREKIDNIVTRGLRLIFGEGYQSKLEFGISRGQAVIKPKIVSQVNGEELEADVADAHGGGLVNIISVIYQILVLALIKPKQKQVLFLDEPFRNVSEEYLEATGEFLKQLNQKLGIQIVLVTHRKQITEVADMQYTFSLENGITKIEKM